MRLSATTISCLLLPLEASGQVDQETLARSRIIDLQKRYIINWDDRPSSNGKPLDKNSDPQVTVYIERHVDKEYVNTGTSDDSFSITKSTTIIKDITEGSSVSAQSSASFQFNAPLSLSISKGGSSNDHSSKTKGSYKSDVRTRSETCEAGHACRFESWTFYVQITGKCQGVDCEIRTPIMDPHGNPMTALIYIPEKMPTGINAILEKFRADLSRNYCIDWTNPPTRDEYDQRINDWESVHRPPAKLLNKPHNVTIYAKRVAEPAQASVGSSDSPLLAERSITTIDSTTRGWSVGAQTSLSLGLDFRLPLPYVSAGGSLQFSNMKSEENSAQESNGKWISDGFSIRTTCKRGLLCQFETWTWYARISGICQNTASLPLQRRCELDVPIFDRAGEPYTQFVIVSNDVASAKDEKVSALSSVDKTKPTGDYEKAPKALGRIGHLCLLDSYEYWGIHRQKYLDFKTDSWVRESKKPKPENLENCNEPLPEEVAEKGNKCYPNIIRAEDLPKDNENVSKVENQQELPKEDGKQAPKVNGELITDEGGRRWCPLDNNKWYNPDKDTYWTDHESDGVAMLGLPKPQGLEECIKSAANAQESSKVNAKLVIDENGRRWCLLDNKLLYNPDKNTYWSDDESDGVSMPDFPKPQRLEECIKSMESTQVATEVTGEEEQDWSNRSWCVLDNTKSDDKVNDLYLDDNDLTGVAKSSDLKPQDLDKCIIEEDQGEATSGAGRCRTAMHVKVTFRLAEATRFGQKLKIVGETDSLGNWEPSKGVELDASEYQHPDKPMWKGDVTLEAGKKIAYKYIKVDEEGTPTWEANPNHSYEVPRTCATTAQQSDTWSR